MICEIWACLFVRSVAVNFSFETDFRILENDCKLTFACVIIQVARVISSGMFLRSGGFVSDFNDLLSIFKVPLKCTNLNSNIAVIIEIRYPCPKPPYLIEAHS